MSNPNSFSLGRDATLNIISSTGPLSFSILTKFDSKPQKKDVHSEGIDGITRHRYLPNGHSGSFSLDRSDSAATDYFVQQEANFFQGLPPDSVTITQIVQELDGSVNTYRYEQVSLWLEDDGAWAGLEKVTQSISFYAARKKKVG